VLTRTHISYFASPTVTESMTSLPKFFQNRTCLKKMQCILNPASGGIFFSVWSTIAKTINFSDLNRSAVARALGRARAMAISMARGWDGKRT
jgi:hypothetical protein